MDEHRTANSATICGMLDQQFGLLSGEQIKTCGLIVDADENLYRASTYDLSVGEIIQAGSRRKSTNGGNSEYLLPPGGMVRVVSRESLHLPDYVTGHVLLKNGLCKKGVLAINIGVADPGFSGPLSSTLINFGKADFVVKKGMSFLRVSFHRCAPSAMAANSEQWDRDEYLERAREEVLAYSAPTFLNIKKTSAQAAKRVFGSFKRSLAVWAAVAAIVLALATIFVPLGAAYVERHMVKEEATREAVQKLQQLYDARFAALSEQLEGLRRAGASPSVPSGRK